MVSMGSYECKEEKKEMKSGKNNPKEIRTWVDSSSNLAFLSFLPFLFVQTQLNYSLKLFRYVFMLQYTRTLFSWEPEYSSTFIALRL